MVRSQTPSDLPFIHNTARLGRAGLLYPFCVSWTGAYTYVTVDLYPTLQDAAGCSYTSEWRL